MSIAVLLAMASSCSEDSIQPSNLTMSGLTIESGTILTVPGTLVFSVDINDDGPKLSTLEVSVTIDNEMVASRSIRTKGNNVNLISETIDIPFLANMPENGTLDVCFEAINVEGTSVSSHSSVLIRRPVLPSTLLLSMGEENYRLIQDPENLVYYYTEEGVYPSVSTAKIFSNPDDPENSEFIWGGTVEDNISVIGDFESDPVSVAYPKYIVHQYAFNTLTFKVEAVGQELDLMVNGVELDSRGNSMGATINFTTGNIVNFAGFDDIENAYNRDFFAKSDDGQYTFIGPSGFWELYYYPKYNYMWVSHPEDTAPQCLWILGHGFTCAPTWNEDYNYGGWDTAIEQLGYCVRTGAETYQCSMFINNTHEWESFEFEIYSDLEWNKDRGLELEKISGASGFAISNSAGITNAEGWIGFIPGYYRLTFNTADKSAFIERIN